MTLPPSLFAPLALLLAFLLPACTTSPTTGTTSPPSSTPITGTYAATFTGTYQNTSPNTESGSTSSSATITVTTVTPASAIAPGEIELTWQIAPNPPSGTAVFLLTGDTGTLADAGATVLSAEAGTISGGSCFTGVVNGNTQTNCCTTCTVSFSGDTFTQPNAGTYAGKTSEGIAYTGNYSGTWTGTIQ